MMPAFLPSTVQRLNRGLRAGTIFAVIIIFLVLIGFTTTLVSQVLPRVGIEAAEDIGSETQRLSLIVFLGLLGAWAGANAAKSSTKHAWASNLAQSLAAGITSGVIVFVFMMILSGLRAGGVSINDYLDKVTPRAIDMLLLGLPAILAGLIYLATLSAAGLIGGILAGLLDLILSPLRTARQRRLRSSRSRRRQAGQGVPVLRYGLFLVLLLMLFALPEAMEYLNWSLNMGTVGIYVLLGLGLNIVVGLAGLLDLGYVAFFAIGAYSMALLTAPEPLAIGWSFWPALLAGIVIAAIAGVLLGLPVLRMRGDYLAIVTLGFGEIISALIPSDLLSDFTGGPQGVRPIASPSVLGETFTGDKEFLYLIILGALLVVFITSRLQNSRIGRAWIAMREDETVAQAVGINTLRYKLLAFAIGAMFASLGGAIYASRLQNLSPGDFDLGISIDVLSLVIVGGMGSIPGVVLGAFVLKGLPELLRDLENYRVLAFGALLVAMMVLRPEGIWPSGRRRLEFQEAMATKPPTDPSEPPQDIVGEEVFT